MATIERIRSGRDNDWVVIEVSDPDDSIPLRASELLRLELARGDTLSPEDVESLHAVSETNRAQTAALNLLAARQRARGELRYRLERKGYSTMAIDAVMAKMDEMGYLDDREFARSFVRDRVRLKPRGRRALQNELRKKRIDRALATEIIEEVVEEMEDVTFVRMALRYGTKWLRTRRDRYENPYKLRQALYGALARKGFVPDVIRGAMDELLESD